jgi:hypothetical protein
MNKLSSPALLVLLFAACGSAPPYAALPIEDDAEQLSNVTIADKELLDVVRVGQAGVDRVPGTNQLRVMVPIRNIDDEPIHILAQMSFRDGRRMPIGDETNQQVKLIGPGATLPLVVISKSDAAQDWVLNLTWNR